MGVQSSARERAAITRCPIEGSLVSTVRLEWNSKVQHSNSTFDRSREADIQLYVWTGYHAWLTNLKFIAVSKAISQVCCWYESGQNGAGDTHARSDPHFSFQTFARNCESVPLEKHCAGSLIVGSWSESSWKSVCLSYRRSERSSIDFDSVYLKERRKNFGSRVKNSFAILFLRVSISIDAFHLLGTKRRNVLH